MFNSMNPCKLPDCTLHWNGFRHRRHLGILRFFILWKIKMPLYSLSLSRLNGLSKKKKEIYIHIHLYKLTIDTVSFHVWERISEKVQKREEEHRVHQHIRDLDYTIWMQTHPSQGFWTSLLFWLFFFNKLKVYCQHELNYFNWTCRRHHQNVHQQLPPMKHYLKKSMEMESWASQLLQSWDEMK